MTQAPVRVVIRDLRYIAQGVRQLKQSVKLFFDGYEPKQVAFKVEPDGFYVAQVTDVRDLLSEDGWGVDDFHAVTNQACEWLESLTYAQKLELNPSRPLEGSDVKDLDGFRIEFRTQVIDGQPSELLRIIPAWV